MQVKLDLITPCARCGRNVPIAPSAGAGAAYSPSAPGMVLCDIALDAQLIASDEVKAYPLCEDCRAELDAWLDCGSFPSDKDLAVAIENVECIASRLKCEAPSEIPLNSYAYILRASTAFLRARGKDQAAAAAAQAAAAALSEFDHGESTEEE